MRPTLVTKDNGLPFPRQGQSAAETIHSEEWWRRLNAAIDSRIRLLSTDRNRSLEDSAVQLFATCKDPSGTGIPLGNRQLFSATGIKPTVSAIPKLQATLRRTYSPIYTTGLIKTNDEGDFYGTKIGLTPVEVEVDLESGYNWYPGLPCGRKRNASVLTPQEGGLILLTEPNADGYAWVVADTQQVWEVALVGATATTTGSGSTYKQLRTIAILKPAETGSIDDVEATDWRGWLTLRATGETSEFVDGTRALVQYIAGEWRWLQASCAASTPFTGLVESIELEE